MTKGDYAGITWSGKCRVVLSDLRAIPRIMVLGYAWLIWDVYQWFMLLPDPTTQQAALISMLTGAGAAIFGLYTNNDSKAST